MYYSRSYVLQELSPIAFFLHKSSLHHVPVFLSDPDILETLDSLPEGTERTIEELFGNRRIVSFGVLEDKWSVKQKVCSIQKREFRGSYIHCKCYRPPTPSGDKNISILQSDSFTILG